MLLSLLDRIGHGRAILDACLALSTLERRTITAMKAWSSNRRGISLFSVATLTIVASAQLASTNSLYPAYHTGVPRTPPPPLLKQDQWTGEFFTHKYQTTAYQMASAVPDVIYQMPCYCWCSKAMGHKSLHSCFENSHGATCGVCMKEAAFAYQQTRAGKTPAEIRGAIENGSWNAIDLATLRMEDPVQN